MFLLAAICVFSIVYKASASSPSQYSVLCDTAFCRIIDESMNEVSTLLKTVNEGSYIPEFGSKADKICNSAIERFSLEAPLKDDDKFNEAVYDKKIEDLERMLDSPLHVIYLKQLALLREKSLKTFKSSLATSGDDKSGGEYEALLAADDFYRREAEESTRNNPDWDYSKDITYLKQSLGEIASRVKKIQDVKLSAAKQTQQAMQYLQMQQQQLQAIQQQIQGSSSPWTAALAYRIPDSNINLSYNFQQGRSNIQLSCVPDEAMSLLGPNGFVQGVTPGNVGLSVNINV